MKRLKNFKAKQPHQHTMYYNPVFLSEPLWHKEELMEGLAQFEVVKRILSNIRIKAHVYGER